MTANKKFPLLDCRLQPAAVKGSAICFPSPGPAGASGSGAAVVLLLLLCFVLFAVFIWRSGSVTTLQEKPGPGEVKEDKVEEMKEEE